MKLGTHKLEPGPYTMSHKCSGCGIVVRVVPASSGLAIPFVWGYDENDINMTYRSPDKERPPMSCEERTMNEALK